jgi:hypothetical protein
MIQELIQIQTQIKKKLLEPLLLCASEFSIDVKEYLFPTSKPVC